MVWCSLGKRHARQWGCLSRHFITPLEEEGPPFLPPVSMESILISAPGTCLSVIKWAHLVFLGACVTGAVKRNEGHKEGITCSQEVSA